MKPSLPSHLNSENVELQCKCPNFRAVQITFHKVSAHDPLRKIVDPYNLSNFAFGQISTSMENIGEKLNQSSTNFKDLTELQFQNFSPKFRKL